MILALYNFNDTFLVLTGLISQQPSLDLELAISVQLPYKPVSQGHIASGSGSVNLDLNTNIFP